MDFQKPQAIMASVQYQVVSWDELLPTVPNCSAEPGVLIGKPARFPIFRHHLMKNYCHYCHEKFPHLTTTKQIAISFLRETHAIFIICLLLKGFQSNIVQKNENFDLKKLSLQLCIVII